MSNIPGALVAEYDDLYNSCVISTNPDKLNEINNIVKAINDNKHHYISLQKKINVPWYVSAIIHNMECSLNFRQHLHNGDSLSRRTINVPAGRPTTGQPPFTWEYSAIDALNYDKFTTWDDWSIEGICYKLEGYNGWGYRKHGIHTPYLWSYSDHYISGKYIKDGVWSSTAVSKQCGAIPILIKLDVMNNTPKPEVLIAVPYATKLPSNPEDINKAKELQIKLNTYQGISLEVDGWAGKRTSNAFKAITGNYLPGDPRI